MFDAGSVGPSAALTRSIARVAAALSIVVVLSALSMTTAMLWALYDVPLERRAGTSGPSLLIEAANGEAIGRVGTLADSVGRQDSRCAHQSGSEH